MFQCQTWSRSRRAGVGNWFPVGGRDAACVFALVRPRPRSAAVGCFAPKFPCPSSSRLFGGAALNGARWGCNHDASGQLLAMQMGRHWRAAGVQFAVKVGELPASIFQEEPAPEREQSAGKVHKEHGNHDQDRRFVLVNQQEAIGNEEGPPTRFRFIRRPCLPRCPASEVERVQSDAATVELADGVAQNALEAIGAIRANAIGTTNTVSNIQNDSFSASEAGEKFLSLT